MVENKSSVNNTLSFGAKSVNPEILKKLLVGRQNTSDYLFDAVKSMVNDRDNQFILIVGQRGMGKTHLLRVLHHSIGDFVKANKLVVAYFSEEEYGIDNYFDFLIRVFNAFMRWNEDDRPFLKTKISELQEIGSKANREQYAEKIIDEYIRERPLLILAENFADILESIKPQEQAKLRAWLYNVNKISIIATSQTISKDFDSEDRPFYGFFNTYYLKKLTYDDTLSFLINLAEIDKRKDVVDFINNKGKGQIRALHQLVKGNHRLLVTFYQFLKSNTLVKLSENFIKTINDLKPYYETYIRYLPPQQQKILRYVALKRKPQKGVDISKNCFIDQKSATKALSELSRKKLIEVITNPSDKRNKLYDINEPLLRISIEVGEHKEGVSALFIDFLAIYYTEEELIIRKQNVLDKLSSYKIESDIMNLSFEIQAIDKAIQLHNFEHLGLDKTQTLKIIYDYLNENSEQNLYSFLIKKNINISKSTYHFFVSYYFLEKLEVKKGLYHIEESYKLNKKNDRALTNWGMALIYLAETKKEPLLYDKGIKKLLEANKLKPNDDFILEGLGESYFQLARINNDMGALNRSFTFFNQANKVNPKNNSVLMNWGLALCEMALYKKSESLFLESIDKYKSIKNLKEGKEILFQNWAISLNGLARIQKDEKMFQESFYKFKESISVNSKNANVYYYYAIAISDLAELKKDESLYKESIEKFKIANELKLNNHNLFYKWGRALSKLAALKNSKHIYIESIEKFKKSTELNDKNANTYSDWGLSLMQLGLIDKSKRRYSEAFEKLCQSVEINPYNRKVYDILLINVLLVSRIITIGHDKNSNLTQISNFYSAGKIFFIINQLLKAKIPELLNKWIILLLKFSDKIEEQQYELLNNIIQNEIKRIPELEITQKYIDVYKNLTLFNNKNAIFELPKEQRLFFENTILDKDFRHDKYTFSKDYNLISKL